MVYQSNPMSFSGGQALGYDMTATVKLNRLGFSNDEINDVYTAINLAGKAEKKQLIEACNYTGTAAYTDNLRLEKLRYLASIIERRTNRTLLLEAVDTIQNNPVVDDSNYNVEEAMSTVAMHYSTLYRKFGIGSDKFTNKGLGTPELRELKVMAIVGGIPAGIFEIYNSNRYALNERFYRVLKVGNTNTTLQIRGRLPVLARGQEPKVPDVGEIKMIPGKDGKNTYVLSLRNKYVGLLSRFVIAASTRRPQIHCGMIEMICKGGTRIYVYAIEWNEGNSVNGGVNFRNDGVGNNKVKIFDYGYNSADIENKLMNVSNAIYANFDGIVRILIKPEHIFKSQALKIKTKADRIEEQIAAQPQSLY